MRIEKPELILMLAALAQKAEDKGDYDHALSLWSQTRNRLESLIRESTRNEGTQSATIKNPLEGL